MVWERVRGFFGRGLVLASRRRAFIVPAALALLPFLFMWDFVLGRVFLIHRDFRNQWLPWQQFVQDSLERGDAPFWNPYLMLGFSQVGESQVGLFYPPNWLTAFFDVEWRVTLVLCLHLALASVGTFFLLRYVKLGRAAASVGAVSYGLAGCMFAQMQNYVIPQGAAYVPLFILWVSQYLDTQRPIYLGYVSLGVGLSLCIAHAGTTFMVLGGVSIYYLARTVRSGRFALDVGLYLGAVALGVLFASVQVFPLLELKPLSERSATLKLDYALRDMYAAGFLQKLSFFFPWVTSSNRGASHVGFGYQEVHQYAGTITPLLALVAVLTARKLEHMQRRFIVALGVAGGVAFALSLGDRFPLVNPWALLLELPGFSMFRVPARWGCIATFCLSALAAFGFQALRSRPLPVRVMVGAAAGLPALAVIAACMEAGPGAVLRQLLTPARILDAPTNLFESAIVLPLSQLPSSALYAAFVAPFLVLYWAFHRGRLSATRFVVASVALLIVDLFVNESPLNPRTSDLSFFEGNQKKHVGGEKSYCRVMPPWRGSGPGKLPMNTAAYFGVFSAMGDTPLETKKFIRLRSSFERREVLDYIGVCYEHEGDVLKRRTGAYPRAFVVPNVQAVGRGRALERFKNASAKQMKSTVYLTPREYRAARKTLRRPKHRLEQQVKITRYENDLVDLTVTTSAPGMLVLTDSNYPGWTATVDGKDARIYSAQGYFRGVTVPAGRHRVRFEFHPTSVYYGALVSLLSLGAFGAALVVFRKRLFARGEGERGGSSVSMPPLFS